MLIVAPKENSTPLIINKLVFNKDNHIYEDNMKNVELELKKHRTDIYEIKLAMQFLKNQSLKLSEDVCNATTKMSEKLQEISSK